MSTMSSPVVTEALGSDRATITDHFNDGAKSVVTDDPNHKAIEWLENNYMRGDKIFPLSSICDEYNKDRATDDQVSRESFVDIVIQMRNKGRGLRIVDATISVDDASVPPTDAPVPTADVPVPPTDASVSTPDVTVPPADAPVPTADVPVPPTDASVSTPDVTVPPADAPDPTADVPVPPTDASVPDAEEDHTDYRVTETDESTEDAVLTRTIEAAHRQKRDPKRAMVIIWVVQEYMGTNTRFTNNEILLGFNRNSRRFQVSYETVRLAIIELVQLELVQVVRPHRGPIPTLFNYPFPGNPNM